MALKLASDLKKAASASAGFDLVFTPGQTYNLDELIANKSRTDASRGLIVEVKKSQDIAEKALNALKNEITTTIESTLYTYEVNEYVKNVIKEVHSKYGLANATPEMISEVSSRVNNYLRSLYTTYNLEFKVYYAGMNDPVKINYKFRSDDELDEYFGKHYDIFSERYAESMKVSEGGIAISNSKNKVRINKNDYSKYLLDKDGVSYDENRKPTEIGVSPTKIRICWEEGTEDKTTPNQVYTVYDEIDRLKNKINELEVGCMPYLEDGVLTWGNND